jgi:predicted RNase H-like nuclease (RuvC/YqgF family)
LADLTKYEIFLSDLNLVESQISILVHKYKDVAERNSELEHLISELKIENTELTQKILRLQNEIQSFQKDSEDNIFNSLNLKEREELKVKLRNLITRIDYHLNADVPEGKYSK